jgi:zinc protease
VVINERKQAYENRPYGLAYERLHQLLFHAGHPYSWPTIGYTADLEEISLSDARSFYERYYAPNNAVLVLAGDLSTSDGFRWAERYFGDLPAAGTRPPVPIVAENRTPGDRVESFDDRVSFPRVYRAYVVAPYGTTDWVHLDVLSYLLADGESSRLQRAMIREQEIAQDVDTFLYPTHLAGIFGIVATARTGISHERLLVEIDRILDGVINDGVTEAEVQGAINRARRDHINGIANMDERAEELAYAATVLGAPERLSEILNSYAEVTAAEVQRTAREYVGRDSRATLVVLPMKEGRNGDD